MKGYKVYYTTNPQLPMTQWESQVVDNNQLTTISELTPHTIYTIRVQAYTSVGPGPLSPPVHVKTQQGSLIITHLIECLNPEPHGFLIRCTKSTEQLEGLGYW